MFNATNLLRASQAKKQLTNYYRSDGFNMLVNALVTQNVPETEIMRTTRGNSGCTLLHDIFTFDFTRWLGNSDLYFKACSKGLDTGYQNAAVGNDTSA